MNAPSSTIKASAVAGAVVVVAVIVLAVLAPELHDRLPPAAGEMLTVAVGTIVGYFKKETVLK